MKGFFAAVHGAVNGTKPTCRPYSAMSGFRGKSGKHLLALSFSAFDPPTKRDNHRSITSCC